MKRLTKKKLHDALFIIGMMEVRQVEAIPDVAWEKSDEYIAEQEKILTQACKEAYAPKLTPRRAIAAVLVAIFLLAVTACAAIEPIREFFIEVFDEYIRVEVDDPTVNDTGENDYPETIETSYIIQNIPSEFMLIDNSENILSTMSLWMDSEGNMLVYEQNIITEESETRLDNGEYSEITIDEKIVFRLYSDGMYVLMWKEHGYLFSISCSDTIPWETVVDMVTGLAPENE